MTTNEREIAIREGHKIHAETSYFTPRPQLDFVNARYVFCEGFDRGYIAATTEANKRMVELESELRILKELRQNSINYAKQMQAGNNHLREALVMFVKDCTGEIIHSTNWLKQQGKKALSATPPESLQAHDDELLERAEKAADSARWAGTDVVLAIRALKEVTK